MKRLLLFTFFTFHFSFFTFSLFAQRPFEGFFVNKEMNIRMELNAYEESIPVPGLELEQCYGHVQGSINGMWIVLKVKELDESHAVVRAISEKGGDAQDFRLEIDDEGLVLKQVGGSAMKGVANRKYVKLPKSFVLKRE